MSEFLIAQHDNGTFSLLNMDKVASLTTTASCIYYVLDVQKEKSGTLYDVIRFSFCPEREVGERMEKMRVKYEPKRGNIFSDIEIEGIERGSIK